MNLWEPSLSAQHSDRRLLRVVWINSEHEILCTWHSIRLESSNVCVVGSEILAGIPLKMLLSW